MERKEEIIYATLELASKNGLKSVSMSQIAKMIGIKAPSLYNHFKSKDEIINAMYSSLRNQAQANASKKPFKSMEDLKDKSLEEILLMSAQTYIKLVSDENMLKFFKVIYSERSTDETAGAIMVAETEKMISNTKDLFYFLAIHKKIANEDVDMAAFAYAMAMHSMIDYQMDLMTAGNEKDAEKITKSIKDFIKFYSKKIGVINE